MQTSLFSTATLFILLVAFGAIASPGLELATKVPDILDAQALKDGSDGKPAVDPCEDFYQFSCGQWIEKVQIPADKDRVMHQFTALADKTDESLHAMIQSLGTGKDQDQKLQTSASQKIWQYFNACMKSEKSAAESVAILKKDWQDIDQLNLEGLTVFLAQAHRKGTSALFAFGSGQDLADANSVIGFLDQAGMGLPEPSFYLDQDKKSVETRKKYLEHVEHIFTLSGYAKKSAFTAAKAVMQIETKLSEKAMSFDDRQNPAKINHPINRADLKKTAPGIDWDQYFKTVGAPTSHLNINEPDFFTRVNEIVKDTKLADLKTYLKWQVAHRSAAELGPKFERENFNFWNKYLHGEKEMKPRWKICTRQVEHKLGYALAEVYVKTIDAEAIRSRIEKMTQDIESTFHQELDVISTAHGGWLDAKTKGFAIKKLEKLKQKLGAPIKWRDYSSLETRKGGFLSLDQQVEAFEFNRDIAKINKPVDHNEWNMMPWEINAYYDPPNNEFVFPFGILQPPSFDLKASEGANLGAFGGGTIGHELTHGYDSDGRQYDADGNVKDWWTPETKKKFEEKSKCYVDQANTYKVESAGLTVDGTKTLTENLADQGGVKLGYLALDQSLKGRKAEVDWLGKYNERQQYWIAYAQSWCGKSRPETLRQQIKTNAHPPEEFRVNGVIMNRAEFTKDFACKPGQKMSPKLVCELW